MKTDTEIRQIGMKTLINVLGAIDAERFVAALLRDQFDYTEWRRINLPTMEVAALSELAASYAEKIR